LYARSSTVIGLGLQKSIRILPSE